jgi:hypothetical protein
MGEARHLHIQIKPDRRADPLDPRQGQAEDGGDLGLGQPTDCLTVRSGCYESLAKLSYGQIAVVASDFQVIVVRCHQAILRPEDGRIAVCIGMWIE